MISSYRGLNMPSADKKGKYKVQVTLDKEQYEKLRKKAFELDMTVNKALIFLALRE